MNWAKTPSSNFKEPAPIRTSPAAPSTMTICRRPSAEEVRRRRSRKRAGHRRQGDNEQDFDRLMAINEDWADHFNEEHRPSSNRISEEGDKKHDAMVNMASRPQSLQDYLERAAGLRRRPDEQMNLMRHVISHINENGYLRLRRSKEIARVHASRKSPDLQLAGDADRSKRSAPRAAARSARRRRPRSEGMPAACS